MKIKFLLFFTLILTTQSKLFASESFIVIGHLYPVIENKKILNDLFDKFDDLNPDFIFILGDSDLHKKNNVNLFKNRFKNKVFFSPGNNEVKNGNLDHYYDNVGYINKVVSKNNTKFILLNSNDNLKNIKNFLKTNVDTNKNITQIILTHHRIWDDTLTSARPYEHDKSFYFKALYPLLKNKVGTIFSGNSKRQYFSDSSSKDVPQNFNNIYWADQIGEISCYSVGTGDGIPKLGFVYVKKIGDKLLIEPHHILSKFIDPIPINKLRLHRNSVEPKKIRSN